MDFAIYNFLISFAVTFLTIPLVIKISKKNGLLDIPDNRKIHKSPTARIGGISIFIGLSISLISYFIVNNNYSYSYLNENNFFIFMLGGFLFFILGF